MDTDAGPAGAPGCVAHATHEARRMAADCLHRNAKCCMTASSAVAFAVAGSYLCAMATELAVEPGSPVNQRLGVIAGIFSTWALAGTAALWSIDLYRRRPARAAQPQGGPELPPGRGDPQLEEIS